MQAPTYRQMLSGNRNYRRLWLGEVVSYLGDWFSTVAIYTMVDALTDSALAIAGVLVAKTLPSFLVTPLVGPIVDRYPSRTLLIASDIARSVVVGGLLLAWMAGSLVGIYAAVIAATCFAGLFMPARQAALPQVVSKVELPVALALSGGTWSVMLAVGAATGGLVTELIGVNGALVLDMLTFLGSAAFLWGLPQLPAEGSHEASTGFMDGMRYLGANPHVLGIALVKSCNSIAAAGLAMLPIFGQGVFPQHQGPLWVGLLYASRGVGALIGSMGVRIWGGDSPEAMRSSLAPGFGAVASGLLVVAWAPNVWWAMAGYLLGALGSGMLWIYSATLLQFAAAPAQRGRVFSFEFGLLTLIMAIAVATSGGLVDYGGWSPRLVVGVAGVLAGLVGTGVALWIRGTVPEEDEGDEAPLQVETTRG